MRETIASLFFALLFVFSFSVEASAHEGDHDESSGKTAEGIADPTSEEEMKAFLAHIEEYYKQREDDTPGTLAVLRRALREQGEYADFGRDIYLFSINQRGTVTNHAKYPEFLGYKFNRESDSEITQVIEYFINQPHIVPIPGGDFTRTGMKVCRKYGDEKPEYDNRKRIACAVNALTSTGSETIIVGLHHEREEGVFTPPDCSGFELGTPAEDVFEDPSDGKLEAYVKGVIRVAQQQMRDAGREWIRETKEEGGQIPRIFEDPNSPESINVARAITLRFYDKISCYGTSEHLKHGNIYSFIMNADPSSPTVVMNGNDPDLNGTNLEARDPYLPGEPKIADLFSEKLGAPASGNSDYVNYHWDDPSNLDDKISDFLERGTVPGTSCKRSYIEVANMTALLSELPEFRGGSDSEWLWIFGSGTYPGDDVCEGEGDDDGGCAIMGAGHTYKGALFNLLLTVSVLFSVVFLKRRA